MLERKCNKKPDWACKYIFKCRERDFEKHLCMDNFISHCCCMNHIHRDAGFIS